jgi:DNA-binding response OmpR family regulator
MPAEILIADDELASRRLLEAALLSAGFECISVANRAEAWRVLQTESPPDLMILDWMMPELDGLEVDRRLRNSPNGFGAYVMLLTGRHSRSDVVNGLQAGADDYITKPFNAAALVARVEVGVRVVSLREALASRVRELEQAFSRVRRLDDKNYWRQVESYISEHSEAAFSHGICPDCYERVVAAQLRGAKARSA